MTLQEIENLTFEELKAQRADILESLKTTNLRDVSERYLQARIDAKQRDEKLAEQGKTITLLQAGHDTLQKQLTEANIALVEATNRAEMGVAEIDRLRGLLRDECDRSQRLKVCAAKHQDAITTAAKALNDAIGRNEIEVAAEGS